MIISVHLQFKGSFLKEHTWKKIMRSGLPQGQLSFLLRAGSDTLPTPVNLKRMRIQCASKCTLCSHPRPTTAHILSGCNKSLEQGRYTWRHDSVLKSIVGQLEDVCSDICRYWSSQTLWLSSNHSPTKYPNHLFTTWHCHYHRRIKTYINFRTHCTHEHYRWPRKCQKKETK